MSVPLKKFRGSYTHSLDPKKRVVVPAKWRDGVDGEIFALLSMEKDHLLIMPQAEYDRMIEKLKMGRDDADPVVIKTMFLVSKMTKDVTFDSQGRMTIHNDHFNALNLEDAVRLVGRDSRFTIWKPETFDAKYSEDAQDADVTAALRSLGL